MKFPRDFGYGLSIILNISVFIKSVFILSESFAVLIHIKHYANFFCYEVILLIVREYLYCHYLSTLILLP